MSTHLTIDQLTRAMPKQVKSKVTQELVDTVNSMVADPLMREAYRDNLLSYTSVMQDGKFKIDDYLNAVKYCSFKLLGSSNIEAYSKTFPDRFQRLIDMQADNKTISSYSTAYNKNILVNKIMEQSLVPSHVLNADLYQKAINVQANLMITASSDKVKSDAANSLLTHLKPPETQKIELDVSHKGDKVIDDLRATTEALVQQQKAMMKSGTATAQDMAHSKLIHAEYEDVTE